ncbi:MAG: ABC transporter substrate-binding protein [Bacteroidota bacterium]
MSFRKTKMPLVLVAILTVCLLLSVFGTIQAEQVTLKVLNYLDASQASSEREIKDIWEAFEKANPEIKIEREDQFNEPFHQRVASLVAAGNLPDVIYMYPGGRSAALHKNRLVKDLRPFLGDTAKEFLPAALVNQAGGYLAEIPIGLTSSHALYINNKMLSDLKLSVPKTYAELKAQVKKLQAAGKDTVLMAFQDQWVGQSCLFSMIAGRLCGDKFFDDVLAGKAKFTDKQFVSALRFFQQLFTDGVLSRKNMLTPYGTVPGLFAAGNAPYLIDGDWRAGAFIVDPTTKQALIPVSEQKNYTMTIFPAIPGEINHETTSGTPATGFGMNAKIPAGSAKEKAAWKLISWLVGPEAQKVRLEIGAAFPSRIGITSEKLEPIMQTRAAFYSKFKSTTYVLDSLLDPQVCTPINVGLQELGLGTTTPEKVAANTQKALEAWRAAQKK